MLNDTFTKQLTIWSDEAEQPVVWFDMVYPGLFLVANGYDQIMFMDEGESYRRITPIWDSKNAVTNVVRMNTLDAEMMSV